jgi:esterase/lipase superfamily enzyme
LHPGLITLAQAEGAVAVAGLLVARPNLVRGGAFDDGDWELSLSIVQSLLDAKELETAEQLVGSLISRSDAGRKAPISVLLELYFIASQLTVDRGAPRVASRRLRSLQNIVVRRVGSDSAEFQLVERALSRVFGNFRFTDEAISEARVAALAGYDDDVKQARSALVPPERQSKLREVFYVTHRARTDFTDVGRFYGGARGDLQFGVATVWTPASPQLAKLPGTSVWRVRFRSKPSRAASLAELYPIEGETSFCSAINAALEASQSRELFMFVHGFNVSFRGGVERTAKLAEDLDLDGAAVLYSWPSQASMISYLVDRNNVIRPFVEDLARFLIQLHQKCNPSSILVVAHSMGNQFMLSALERAQREISDHDTTTEIVFASPDVDSADFEAGVRAIAGGAKRQTLYASSRDRALQLSARIQSYRRAGDASIPVVMPGLETIDTTCASKGLIGHIDFAGTALDDFRALSWFHMPPSKRRLLGPADCAAGMYWRMHNLSQIAEEAAAFALALVVSRRLGDEAMHYVEDLLRNTRRWDRKLNKRGKRLAEIVAEIALPAD